MRRGSIALATLITVAFAYLAVRDVEFGEIGRSLRESNYWYLLPALVLLAVAFVMRALRWQALFSPPARLPLWPTTQALLVGQFLNNVLPLRAGDAARILALHSLGARSRAEVAGTVVIERVFDVLALLLLLFVGLPLFPEVTWVRAAGTLAIILTIVLAAAVIILRLGGERAIRFMLKPLAVLPLVSAKRVEFAVRNLNQGVIALRSTRLGLVGFAWTVLSWLVLAASFWLVMIGFDLELSLGAGLLVVIATGLSLIIPSAPAAVGVFEAATIVALAAYGTPPGRALSYAIVVHALNVLPFVAAGLVVLNFQRGLLRPVSGERRDELLAARARGGEPAGVRASFARDPGRAGDHEDDVTEKPDRYLEVDQARDTR